MGSGWILNCGRRRCPEVALEQITEGKEVGYAGVWEENSTQREQLCKGPEATVSLIELEELQLETAVVPISKTQFREYLLSLEGKRQGR